MQFVANYMDVGVAPAEWARAREAQGWDVLSVADHLLTDRRPFPHVWVTVSAIASATTRPQITTAFVNNLLRSPVEVAQAALMMQQVADGRFELGLGAGWARQEVEDAGMTYPSAAERAGAFAESAEIIRSILHTGGCRFRGAYYTVDIAGLGPVGDEPPPLVCSVGGRRTIREVTPHCDRVELKPASAGTRSGSLDLATVATVRDRDLRELVARVRDVDPDIGIGMFVLCNVGEDSTTRGLSAALGDGLMARFTGPAAKVVENLEWLAGLGISRAQISPIDGRSFDRLAPHLFT
jgi:alkanesulfonate monooxygenase SsuD/methylene tetrahydromethanopterin reductase-like flavin-dependent oxidoreductase (luciferase family)